MRNSESHRLIFFDGVNGVGKSFTSLAVHRQIELNGVAAWRVVEMIRPHPVDVRWDLFKGKSARSWDTTAAEVMELSLAKWAEFVKERDGDNRITLIDGCFFHGDLTLLTCLGCDYDEMLQFFRAKLETIERLVPKLVYLYQPDVRQLVQFLEKAKGPKWLESQQEWKLTSPYASSHGLRGRAGLEEFYRYFCMTCDALMDDLPIATQRLDVSRGRYAEIHRTVTEGLGYAYQRDRWATVALFIKAQRRKFRVGRKDLRRYRRSVRRVYRKKIRNRILGHRRRSGG